MLVVRIVRRAVQGGIVAALLAGCAEPALVGEDLSSGGAPATEFSIDDSSVTLRARFDAELAADAPLTVEWLFPDGKVYLRKPVHRSYANPDIVETAIPVRGKAPARYPGVWHVRLWRGADTLVDRSFEIRPAPESAESAGAQFAALSYCGPAHWNDPAISGRRSSGSAGVPGAWVGTEVLSAAGATYSGAVLLSGCAPG